MIIQADEVPATPWKNRGGLLRDLLYWPSISNWQVRISLAEIEADGPFSPYPGVTRWFALTAGAGVVLRFAHGLSRRRGPGDEPLCFDGGAAPHCTLIDGPAQALNLMLRDGATGVLRATAPARPWPLHGRYDPATRCLHWAEPEAAAGPGLHLGAQA